MYAVIIWGRKTNQGYDTMIGIFIGNAMLLEEEKALKASTFYMSPDLEAATRYAQRMEDRNTDYIYKPVVITRAHCRLYKSGLSLNYFKEY